MSNKLITMVLTVVIGLGLLPIATSFANELTYEPEANTFVTSEVLPASENLQFSWTTLPSSWSTSADKAFVSTTAAYFYIGIDTSAAGYEVDASWTALTTETSITLDTSEWSTAQRTLLASDALATTYGFTYTDLDDYGAYYDTSVGSIIDLVPMFFVLALIGGVVVYIKFN